LTPNSKFVGQVSAVRGSVLDVHFPEKPPPIHSLLFSGNKDRIIVEAADHVDAHLVRGIALTATAGLAKGDEVRSDGNPLQAPVSRGVLGRVFNVFGRTIDGKPELPDGDLRSVHQPPISLANRVTKQEVFLTGIKAIDLLAPLERGGKAGLFGGAGVP